MPTVEVCRKHGDLLQVRGEAWRARGRAMSAIGPRRMASDAGRRRALEDENGKLKKRLAETMSDNANLKDVATRKGSARRQTESGGPGLRDAQGKPASRCPAGDCDALCRERACQALALDRSSGRYLSVRPDDADARAAMKAVAGARRRFGCRRIPVTLERQGVAPPGRFWPGQIACRAVDEPQEAAAAVSRGTASGAPQGRPQADPRKAAADAGAGRAERTLEPGFRERCADGYAAVPCPRRGRRLQPGMPYPCGGHLAVGSAGRQGPGHRDRPQGQARDGRFR